MKQRNQSSAHYNKPDSTTVLCLSWSQMWRGERRQAEVDVPATGWVGCPPACGIYWGSRTEGPPIEFSTAFQPAPSPASASCRSRGERQQEHTRRWRSTGSQKSQLFHWKWKLLLFELPARHPRSSPLRRVAEEEEEEQHRTKSTLSLYLSKSMDTSNTLVKVKLLTQLIYSSESEKVQDL